MGLAAAVTCEAREDAGFLEDSGRRACGEGARGEERAGRRGCRCPARVAAERTTPRLDPEGAGAGDDGGWKAVLAEAQRATPPVASRLPRSSPDRRRAGAMVTEGAGRMGGEQRVDVLRIARGECRRAPRCIPAAPRALKRARPEGHRAGLAQVHGPRRACSRRSAPRASRASRVSGDHQDLGNRRRAGKRFEHVLEHRDEEHPAPCMRVEARGSEALLGVVGVLDRQQGVEGRGRAHPQAPLGAGARGKARLRLTCRPRRRPTLRARRTDSGGRSRYTGSLQIAPARDPRDPDSRSPEATARDISRYWA